jgi:hypothetical protein
MFRARMASCTRIGFDEMRSTPTDVILTARVDGYDPVVTVFNLSVLTSAAPRAIETAIAMGVAVDDTVDLPSGYVPGEVGFHEQWTWTQPWVRYAELVGRRARCRDPGASGGMDSGGGGRGRWRDRVGRFTRRRDRADVGGLPPPGRPRAVGRAAGPL